MENQDIINKARLKLPDIIDCKYHSVVVPIFKPVPIEINKSHLPDKKSSMYEVYFEKYCRYVGDTEVWRYVMTIES